MNQAPNYKTNDPLGWCGDPRRGAAMGRPTIIDTDKTLPHKLYLRRIRLVDGDYDVNGTYFGYVPGRPLYWVADADGLVDYVVRAASRDDAKAEVREQFPNARFYR